MSLRVLTGVALIFLASAHAAEACKYRQGPFLQDLAAVSKSAAIASADACIATAPVDPETANSSCSDDPWMSFSADAASAISSHGALMLGEMHDNPSHHVLQAAAVTEFAKSGSKDAPAVVFEQIRDDQQPGLERFANFNRNAARLEDGW